jgi:hypothetical protein
MKKGKELSAEIAKKIRAKPKHCWRNAEKALAVLPDAVYVEGFAAEHGLEFEHGWLEWKGQIIDPTLPHEDLRYYGGVRVQGKKALTMTMLKTPDQTGCNSPLDLPLAWRFGWGGSEHSGYQKALHRARNFNARKQGFKNWNSQLAAMKREAEEREKRENDGGNSDE